MWQTKARCCGVGGGGEQLCAGGGVVAGVLASHEKYPGWTLPGHMVLPLLRQRVGLLPLSTESEAAGLSVPAAARSEGGLCMTGPSWVREPGQAAAPPTGEPHLGCVLAITIITPASRNQESWEEAD